MHGYHSACVICFFAKPYSIQLMILKNATNYMVLITKIGMKIIEIIALV